MKNLLVLFIFLSTHTWSAGFKEQAPKVAQSLKKNLMGNLQKELSQNGVLKALDFCHLHVKDLAQETFATHELKNQKSGHHGW